jgi:hypothetical protein
VKKSGRRGVGLAAVTELRVLKWRDCQDYPGGFKCNHKCPYKDTERNLTQMEEKREGDGRNRN